MGAVFGVLAFLALGAIVVFVALWYNARKKINGRGGGEAQRGAADGADGGVEMSADGLPTQPTNRVWVGGWEGEGKGVGKGGGEGNGGCNGGGDWVELEDTETGNTYYYCEATKQTTWNRPASFSSEVSSAEVHRHSNPMNATTRATTHATIKKEEPSVSGISGIGRRGSSNCAGAHPPGWRNPDP